MLMIRPNSLVFISKPVYQSLKALCRVGHKCSIISKEKLTNEDFADLALLSGRVD